jgi:enterochelin esterase-like enzyme
MILYTKVENQMNYKHKMFLFAAIIACGTCLAQTNQQAPFSIKDDGKWTKVSSTHRLAQFPKINPDGRVWFQYKAPKTAQSVKLHFYNTDYDMQKDTSGLWNLVLANPQIGYQVYWMIVDGVAIQDPGSDIYYSNGYTSVIEVPAPEDEFYLPKNVPHGDVREHWFYSKVTGSYRRMFVYTPPDYDKNTQMRYPVLYLQHGAGELEMEWTHSGKANFILDNLIAEGKSRPMIIVMNNGFATRPGQDSQALTGNSRWAAFEDMLITEVIPDIDSYYRTIPDREHRAMAGLSMGGMQTFSIGLNHIETFSHIGVFSGVPTNYNDYLKSALQQGPAFNKQVKLLWFGAGTNEAAFINRQKELQDLLTKSGIQATFFVSNGTQHEFQTWRRCLHEFAPLLFKDTK